MKSLDRFPEAFVIAVIAIASVVVMGCEWVPASSWTPDGAAGRLRIRLPEPDESRSIVPGLDMAIDRYHVSVAGPGSAQEQYLDSAATTTTFTDLAPGDWTLTVDAENADDPRTVIARDVQIVTIEAGMTETVNVTVRPLAGAGTLQLTVTWPDGVLASPGVVATLTDGSATASDIGADFVIDTAGAPDQASYDASTWEAGYYTLSLALTDGAVTVWGPELVAVRIIAGEVSSGIYTLADSDLNLLAQVGSVEVNIGADLQNPYSIAFSGQLATMAPDATMTVTAAIVPTVGGSATYEWYLNGVLQPDDGSSIVLDGSDNLVDGTAYRLSLLVRDGPTVSSESTSFRVESAGP